MTTNNNEIRFWGFSHFCFGAIPAVLGLAALWWLAFGQGLHYFRRELSQEQRRAEFVGAATLPTAPLIIKTDVRRDAVIEFERVEIDGGDVLMYVRNVSQASQRFVKIHWKLSAPDGTIVRGGDNYASLIGGADRMEPGERAELTLKVKADPRATTLHLRVSTFDQPD